MISQNALTNLKTFFTQMTCVPGDNVMDSAELINSELKCLDRWQKSNKISTMQIKPSTCCSLIIKM